MFPRNVVRFVCALALLQSVACDDAKAPAGDGGFEPDGGDKDASVPSDGGDKDARVPSDGGDKDASVLSDGGDNDARVPSDAGDQMDAEAADAEATDAEATDADTADAAPDSSAPDAALPALSAWYTFDETSGTAAADSSGNGANALLHNEATWTTGKEGGAVDLTGGAWDGENPFVSIPPNVLGSCQDVTIALWLRLRTVTPWSRILDLDGKVNGFLFFTPAQFTPGGGPYLYFNIFYPDGVGDDNQGVSAPYPAGTTLEGAWHHVAFTLADGTGRLYFDGVQIGMSAMSATPANIILGELAAAWIGRSVIFQDPYLDGTIDDLRISCSAYSAAQIAELAQVSN